MVHKVKVEIKESENSKIRLRLNIVEQSQINDLVELFLKMNFEERNKLLDQLN